ncbi:nitric oxide reductase activation protein NorD [Grimontia hollisae]|uniref:nitric oxide reductase activation protein NorD n=1 Tax=Grimontia hollisae TaxID=673 RepID=UPI001E5C2739|nr:VWA domain-containing protein [Grimontia hollisae]
MESQRKAKAENIEGLLASRTETLQCAFQAGLRETESLGSAKELDAFLNAATCFCSSKQPDEVITAFFISVPKVVKNNCDNVTIEIKESIDTLSKWLGVERLTQFLNVLPQVSARLCSREALIIYLKLVNQLTQTAPRCLKVFLLRSPHLLTTLPILGLRHWAMIGAHSHAHQIDALNNYFTLQSPESQSIFQRQRKGTLFVDVQRHLHFYLRAIWGRDFFLRPMISNAAEDIEEHEATASPCPTLSGGIIALPDALESPDDNPVLSAKNLYRASAAHAVSHLMYSRPRVKSEHSSLQQYCVELLEDARVEALAIHHFPGLRQLWLPFHLANANGKQESGLSLGLLTGNIEDAATPFHPIINAFNQLITLDNPLEQQQELDKLSGRLAEILQHAEGAEPLIYRDDNACLWHESTDAFYPWPLLSEPQVKRTVNVMEMVNEIDNELADDNAQEIWVLEYEFFRDGDPENVSMNELEGKQQVSSPFYYPEWDYSTGQIRPSWVTLTERSIKKGTSDAIDALLDTKQAQTRKIRTIVEALQPKGLQRLRKQFEGDELDLDAAIEAIKEIRRGALPDMNIDQRLIRRERDLAVLVLLDLSQSTMEALPDANNDSTVLEIAKEATVMLANAINDIGDPFAIHGFYSNGRNDVRYQRFKDFEQAYDDDVKAKLAGMTGSLSTRMGSALRHAKTFLAQQPQQKKLLLLISDGEPSDIDCLDPLYLQADTKHAVDDALAMGITPFCLTIDTEADHYIGQMFGSGHYSILDNASRLPDVLPSLFASITRAAY